MKTNLFQWISLLSWGIICSSGVFSLGVNAIEFPGVSEREPPKSTAAGGRRGGCVSGDVPIKALTPGDDNYITTASSEAQLYVYIPKTKAQFAQFILKNEGGENIDVQEIPLNKGDYIMTIKIPELETEKKYQWEVSLICNPMFINSGNYIKGTIEKVSLTPELQAKLSQNQDALTQAEIYASAGIWSETLILVSSIRESKAEVWQKLLSSVGLQDYANKNYYQNPEEVTQEEG